MNDAAQHMRELREGWKSMGFQPVTLYIHDSEVEQVRGEAFARTGRKLLSILPTLTEEQLEHLALRKLMPVPALSDVAVLRQKLADAPLKNRKRFDKFYEEFMSYMVLRKRVETLDFPTAETMTYASAEAYAWSYVIYGTWAGVKDWYGEL